MKKLYTLIYINKQNNKLLRRYSDYFYNPFYAHKASVEQLDFVLNSHLDLDKRDIDFKVVEGNLSYDEINKMLEVK